MSVTIDQFCDNMRNRLDGLDDRFVRLKASIEALPHHGEQALHKCLDRSRCTIDADKKKVEQSLANLKARAEQKLSQTKEEVNEWKAKRETKKLSARADHAAEHAADAIDYAVAMIIQAEEAIFDAAAARIDADSAQSSSAAAH